MPISIAQMASNTASVTFLYGEDPVTVVYYPANITEKTFAIMDTFGNMDLTATMGDVTAGFQAFNEMLAGKPIVDMLDTRPTGLIKSWDVFEDMEQTRMFPVRADRFSELPLAFRVAVLYAVLRDFRPESVAPQIQNHTNHQISLV